MTNRSRQRIAAIAAASWVLATLVTSLVVWQAVAVFRDGSSTSILSAPQVGERLEAARATQSPTPTSAQTGATTTATAGPTDTTSEPGSDEASPSAEPTGTPTTSATPTATLTESTTPTASATPVVTTWTLAGGSLSVSCQAQVISLLYASPQDGWRVETENQGTARIDVNFERVGQGIEVRATCVDGVPSQTSQPTDGDH